MFEEKREEEYEEEPSNSFLPRIVLKFATGHHI